ncbi:MAG: hypothetical protein K6G26_08430 [Lachnospiraceae bacterium]|nr:hypothetical protein [Lachnospiraceae bacterium]
MEQSKESMIIMKTLLITMAALMAIECVFSCIIWGNMLKFILGGTYGLLIGCGFILHMYRSIDISLDMMEESRAKKYYIKQYVLRMFAVAAFLAIGMRLHNYLSVIAMFMGVMNIKLSVYLYPLTNRYINKGR